MATINETVRKHTDNLAAADFKIDETSGVAAVRADVYKEALVASGGSVEAYEAQAKFDSEFLAATHNVLGEQGIPFLKSHPEINRVTLEVPKIGNDKISLTLDRKIKVPGGADGEQNYAFGIVTSKVETYAYKSVGQMAAVKTHLKELSGGLSDLSD
jgi:hypothetical protein